MDARATAGSLGQASVLERRRSGRHALDVPLTFRPTWSLPRGEGGTGVATEMADAGIRFRTNRPIEIGQWIRLDWSPSLPALQAMPARLRPLTGVKARVVRAVEAEADAGKLPYSYAAVLATRRATKVLALFDLALPWMGLLLILATAFHVLWLRGNNLYYFWYHPIVNLYSLLISGYILSRIALACVYSGTAVRALPPHSL